MPAILYLLTTNQKDTYIGFTTVSLERREKLHKMKAQRKSPVQKVHKAIRACGNLFWIKPLCIGTEEYIRHLEEKAIETFKPSLNVNIGSRASPEVADKIRKAKLGRKLSEETKAKMSAAKIGNQNALGMTHSEEHKNKLRYLGNERRGKDGRYKCREA